MKTKVRDYDKAILRLPDGLRDEIREAAARNGHSMNTEMVARLQVPAKDRLAEIEAKLDAVLARLKA